MTPRPLLQFSPSSAGQVGNTILESLGPVLFLLLSGGLLWGMARNAAVWPFPLFGGVVILVYLTAGSIWAFVVACFATLIGEIGFLFSSSHGSKAFFVAHTLLIWLLFYLMYQVHRRCHTAQCRAEEEFDRLDLDTSRLSSDIQKLHSSLEDCREQLTAYNRLQLFTDDLVGAYTREELIIRAHKGIGEMFPSVDVQLRLFERPNTTSMDDDWGHRAMSFPQPKLFYVRKTPVPSQKVGTFILVPVKMHDNVVGWVGLDKGRRRRLFDVQDLRLAMIAVDLISLALGNANLFSQTESLAISDGLTGLYTRGYFNERLEEEFAKAKHNNAPLSLLLFDVDHFKLINDTYGHNVGDDVLRSMAHTISAHVRETDFAARYGGDEFIVLMPHTPASKAMEFSHRLFKSVSRAPFRWGEDKIEIALSGGVACLDDSIKSGVDLIERADQALYKAKARGRNQVVKD